MASIAGGTSTCETSSEILFIPRLRACQTSMALAGAVVSNPMAKNTTFFSGLARAIFRQSSGEYTTRTSPPCDLMLNKSPSDPGTRSMSPKEQKITSGRARNGVRLVDHLQRRDADRAARAVHQFHSLWAAIGRSRF